MLDWGSLTRLYRFAPRATQDAVASDFQLSGPQLASWLQSLNIVRNVSAHHGRLFNKVHAIKPKMPLPGVVPNLDEVADHIVTSDGGSTGGNTSEYSFGARTFGQLSLIQHLLTSADLGGLRDLPAVLARFPSMDLATVATTGAPAGWCTLQLWRA